MEKEFKLSIMTPQKNFFYGKISQMNLEIANGRIGILSNHIPIISSIKTSLFSIIEKGILKEGVIIGGIIYMNGESALVITSKVKWLNDVNVKDAKKRLSYYQKLLNNSNSKKISNSERKMIESKIIYYTKQIN